MNQIHEREYIVDLKFRKKFSENNVSEENKIFVAKTKWLSEDASVKSNSKFRNILTISLKIFKIVTYSFLFLVGLWGCFQSMIEPEVKTQTVIGAGLEFGFLTGTTDFRYLLGKGSSEYFVFSIDNWTMDYGPFYGLFVWPGASLVLEIMFAFRDAWGGLNALLGILTLVFIVRMLSLTVSLRSTTSTERMQEIQPRIAEIKAKYKDLKDMNSRAAQQAETNAIYKKYGVKPFAPFEQLFITMPIFLVTFRVITILRPLKDTYLFNIWNLSEQPLEQITGNFGGDGSGDLGGWVYIFFLLIIIPIQILSQKLPQILSKKRNGQSFKSTSKGQSELKKTKMIQIVMMVILAFVVVTSAAGVGLYWGLSSLFTIGQTIFIHWLIVSRGKKTRNASVFFKEIGLA